MLYLEACIVDIPAGIPVKTSKPIIKTSTEGHYCTAVKKKALGLLGARTGGRGATTEGEERWLGGSHSTAISHQPLSPTPNAQNHKNGVHRTTVHSE